MSIRDKKDLKEFIDSDNTWFISESLKEKIVERAACYPTTSLKRYLKYLRKQEYYINTARGNKLKGLLAIYFERKKNKYGIELGIEIGPNSFEKGLQIYHIGSIIINPSVRVGENCKLHGNNCIGNDGKTQDVPKIGNNVDIGYGAVIIGDLTIADNVVIGANAVVKQSILEEGSVVAGVPAKRIK